MLRTCYRSSDRGLRPTEDPSRLRSWLGRPRVQTVARTSPSALTCPIGPAVRGSTAAQRREVSARVGGREQAARPLNELRGWLVCVERELAQKPGGSALPGLGVGAVMQPTLHHLVLVTQRPIRAASPRRRPATWTASAPAQLRESRRARRPRTAVSGHHPALALMHADERHIESTPE